MLEAKVGRSVVEGSCIEQYPAEIGVNVYFKACKAFHSLHGLPQLEIVSGPNPFGSIVNGDGERADEGCEVRSRGQGSDGREVATERGEREVTVEQTACAGVQVLVGARKGRERRWGERFEDDVEDFDWEVDEGHDARGLV